MRAMAAAALAQLRLKTWAREVLEALPPALMAEPSMAALAAAIDALPSDELRLDEQLGLIDRNLAALGARGAADVLRAAVPLWMSSREGWRWFRAAGGNVVRLRADGGFMHLADHAGAATRFMREHLAGRPMPEQLTIEGLDPPWLAFLASAALARQGDGFQPRLLLVQRDPVEALDAMACADLSAMLEAARTAVFVGERATAELEAFLVQRLDSRPAGPVVPLLSMRSRCASPTVAEVQQTVNERIIAEHLRLTSIVQARAASRGGRHWARRLNDPSNPPRILIPTTRYSTFVQHAARDLAAAFECLGCRAQIMIESDASSRWNTLAYLRQLEAFDPDAVVMINYFRRNLDPTAPQDAARWLPDQLPLITWLQDDMPHQRQESLAGRLHELDFVAGHLERSTLERLGVPRHRTIQTPVVASREKFHPAAPTPSERERFGCDIAYVSHHSETPEAMHARLCAEGGAAVAGLLERLRPAVESIDPLREGADQLLALAGQVLGTSVPADVSQQLARQYVVPMAERRLRHQTLAWAVEIAARRGWRLRVFGKGWRGHALLASMPAAAGDAVEHGAGLRAAYAAAAAHLHISITAPVHQRVAECALSGGLPLIRLTHDAIRDVRKAALRAAWLRQCDDGNAPGGRTRLVVADHPELMALVALQQRLGLTTEPPEQEHTLDPSYATSEKRHLVARAREHRADWLLGDLAQVTFASAASLEAAMQRAIERPQWRTAASRLIADRVDQGMTSERLARQMLAMLRRNLAPGEPARGPGA